MWGPLCAYLQRYIAPVDTVLELGAGYCDFINQIRAGKKLALDVNPEVAKYCAPDVTFLHAGADAIPIDVGR